MPNVTSASCLFFFLDPTLAVSQLSNYSLVYSSTFK